MNIPITCPHCSSETDIFVEIDSPSDYYFAAECDCCGKTIKKLQYYGKEEFLDDIVYDAVMDEYSVRADYLFDSISDR